MDTVQTKAATLELSNTYAKYFINDFSKTVLSNLRGSYPMSQKERQDLVDKTVAQMFGDKDQIEVKNTNAIGRFLYECAEHALSQDLDDPAGLEAWSAISALPSAHHEEIQALSFSVAEQYDRTVNGMVLGVIAKDASIAANSIRQKAQARTSVTETGGVLHKFNWGILGDGLWLNGALMTAYEKASIFRQGDPISSQYAVTAFGYAAQYARMSALTDYEQSVVVGELDLLISQIDQDQIAPLLTEFSQQDLNSLLFQIGDLSNHVRKWEDGLRDTDVMVKSIGELSAIAQIMKVLSDSVSLVDDETMLGEITRSRISQVSDAVTLSLVAYEALRETKYASSVILSVTSQDNDPKVDVIVNNDMTNLYQASGGTDEDLIKFGTYLDPRKGIPPLGAGWNQEYIAARRDDVIPKVMAEESERIERLRNNDAAVIQEASLSVINGVVNSYMTAKGDTAVRPDIFQRINGLSRQITGEAAEFNLDVEIAKILVQVVDDPFVSEVSDRLFTHMEAKDHSGGNSAIVETIVQTAASDIANLISADHV